MSSFRTCIRISAALLLFVVAANAHALGPKGDIYLGYSRLGSNTFEPTNGGLNGLEGAAHLKIRHFLGVEADVAHYGYGASSSTARTTTFLVGPRFTLGVKGFKVFAHGMGGGAYSSANGNISTPFGEGSFSISETHFAYAFGAGAEVPIAPFFAWRVTGDVITPDTIDADKTRFSTGLVFKF